MLSRSPSFKEELLEATNFKGRKLGRINKVWHPSVP